MAVRATIADTRILNLLLRGSTLRHGAAFMKRKSQPNPGSTNDPSLKTTLNRSEPCDTPLTGSAFRSGPKAAINYGHSPRSGRRFPAFETRTAPTPLVDPGLAVSSLA